MRVAVVGSGPAGFYAAGALLSADPPAEVDMIERLPTPWGLVRLGVAPDHPKLKSVSRAFERIADQPGFRFLGNVEVGRDLQHDDLVRLYDAVIYAVGAQTDRRLGIPGEDLPGSWAATEFVAWYNGHPDYQQLEFDLSAERAVVIGNGNVALDIARMLALTHDELAPTDATDASIAAIESSPIREIVVVGRRGPAQAAFTDSRAARDGRPRRRRRRRRSGRPRGRRAAGHERRAQPGRAAGSSPPASPRASRAASSSASSTRPWRSSASSASRESSSSATSSTRTTAPCRLTSTRRCHAGSSSAAWATTASGCRAWPFDEKTGTIPNEGGRIEPGVYCAGWIKRGPTGVIGTNKKDATETVELLLEDAAAGRLQPKPEADRRRRRHAARRARRACRRVRRLVGDRRGRAGGRREVRSAARKAVFLGRAARGGGTGSESIMRGS
jgi:ferredoxin--NADP+ reductase